MPLLNQVHVDKALTNVSVKYHNSEYIADQVFPSLPVNKLSDKYFIYDRDFRVPETKRAIKGEAREHTFELSTASYQLVKHSLKDLVADDEADNFDLGTLRADTVEELTDKIMLRREDDCAKLFTSTSWSQNVSLSTAQQFSLDTTTSSPVPIFDTAATAVLENSGFRPNYGIIPHNVLIAIKNHSQILERIKYTSMEITKNMIAGLLDIDELLVPTAVKDSAAKGASASIAAIWQDNAFVGYKPARASLRSPSAGYIFEKKDSMVKRWREEPRDGEMIEVTKHYDIKVVASLAGYLIKDTLA